MVSLAEGGISWRLALLVCLSVGRSVCLSADKVAEALGALGHGSMENSRGQRWRSREGTVAESGKMERRESKLEGRREGERGRERHD